MMKLEAVILSRCFEQTYPIVCVLYEVGKIEWAVTLREALAGYGEEVLTEPLINAFDWFDTEQGWLYWNSLHTLSKGRGGGEV